MYICMHICKIYRYTNTNMTYQYQTLEGGRGG